MKRIDFSHSMAGFTLIEVMIAMVILGLVLTGIVKMFSSTGKYQTAQEMMVDLTQDMRAAKQLMTYEIREAGCNPRGKKRIGFQISTDDSADTDANSIHFTTDRDNGDGDEFLEPDGDADDPGEDIAFYRTFDNCFGTVGAVMAAGDRRPGCLRYAQGGSGQPVAANIIDLQFNYYDSNNNPFYQENADGSLVTPLVALQSLGSETNLDRIRSVQVFMMGQVENPSRVTGSNQTWTQRFRIRVRNAGK
ncbi:MAG TPA: prepilin-type N-terminal cleavage/methylation domain-containing protein [Desulfobulbus sp.]|nr:prepilin-type N-terminal cleavage/methylation domain-containing protein [Desulfobulbus sp.]